MRNKPNTSENGRISAEYGIGDIDKYGCVKPGIGMMLTSIFFCRQILYAPIMLLAKRRTRGSSGAEIDLSYIQIFSVWELIACIPAMLVLMLIWKRKPSAGNLTRKLWLNAKKLLLLSAATNILVLGYTLFRRGIDDLFLITSALLTVYICYFLLTSKRVVDTVNDFPSSNEKG